MVLSELLGTVSSVLTFWKDKSSSQTDFDKQILKAAKFLKSYEGGSMLKILQDYVIEPTIFITNTVGDECPEKEHEAVTELVDLFASYFTQVFRVLCDIKNQDYNVVTKLLGTQSNPSFNVIDYGKFGYATGKKLGLLSLDNSLCDLRNQSFLSFGTEASGKGAKINFLKGVKATIANDPDKKMSNFKDDYSETTKMDINRPDEQVHHGLHIRTFEITINGERNLSVNVNDVNDPNSKDVRSKTIPCSITIPFMIKANIVKFSTRELILAVAPKTSDKSFIARWRKYRSGAISFWNDLILCNDLIKEHKENKFKNENELDNKIDQAKVGSWKTINSAGSRGYEAFYNMFLMTARDKAEIEKMLRGNFKSDKFKEEFLTMVNGLQALILDPDWQMGELYVKDLKGPSLIKFANIGKRKGRGQDGNLHDLLKMLYSSNPPVF